MVAQGPLTSLDVVRLCIAQLSRSWRNQLDASDLGSLVSKHDVKVRVLLTGLLKRFL